MVCLGSLRQREVLGAAGVTSSLLAGPHCALTLGEEPKDADNEALPVQPNRRRKASAEERLDTIPALENTMVGGGDGRTNPPPPQLFVGGIVYCWRRTIEGAWPGLVQKLETASWVWGRPFLDQCNKRVLQTEAPNLGKGLMSGKGIFLIPWRSRCQYYQVHPRLLVKHLPLRCCGTKQISSAWGMN